MSSESESSKKKDKKSWEELQKKQKKSEAIKGWMDKDTHKDKHDKKDHCSCQSHGLTACFFDKHDHHDKCCFDHHHDHHHNKCFFPHHGHCNEFFLKDHCCSPLAFSHNDCCNDHFHLHLAGLNGNLNFQLFSKKGCCAKVHFECASATKTVVGRVCNIGVDFVDILKDDRTILTIMKEKICSIQWLDKCKHDCHLPKCDKDDDGEECEESFKFMESAESPLLF